MNNKFATTQTLPLTDCDRQDFYDLLETMDPTATLADAKTIEVVAGVLYCMLNVPRWVQVASIEHTALQTAALTNDIQLLVLPAAAVVHAVKIKHKVAFAGTGITKYLLSVGVAGALSKYAAPFDVSQVVGDTVMGFNSQAGAETHNASGTNLRLAAEAVGANLAASTAGSVDVWVLYSATLVG